MAAQNQGETTESANPGIEDAEAGGTQIEELAEQADEVQQEGSNGTPELRSELEVVQAEAAAALDQVLRAQAEIQNIRRRAERDVESASKYAIEKFSGALIPVIDNLERALSLMDTDNEQIRPLNEGIELTHRSFIDVLQRFGIEVLDPAGEPFDPACHEAISTVENDEVEPNTVLQVVQKGYLLNGRVLRAAMVLVAKPQARVDETA